MARLFVYGTLKRGHCRAHVLDGQTFLGEAVTRPRYRLFDCGEYPALIAAEQGLPIEGELWEIGESLWPKLDEIEGVEIGLYERRQIAMQSPHDDKHAISYFYLPSTANLRDIGVRWPSDR